MNVKEMHRLNEDHPDWVELAPPDLYRRYWMYDHQRVALARVTAAWRILTKPLMHTIERALDRLTRLLTH